MEQPEKGLFAYIYVCVCVLCQFLGHTTLLAVELELSGMENFGCEITNKVFFPPILWFLMFYNLKIFQKYPHFFLSPQGIVTAPPNKKIPIFIGPVAFELFIMTTQPRVT
jgi:hypothetical protein